MADSGEVLPAPIHLDLRVEVIADELIYHGGTLTPSQISGIAGRMGITTQEVRRLIGEAWVALAGVDTDGIPHKRQAQLLRLTNTIKQCLEKAGETDDPRWIAEATKQEMLLARILWESTGPVEEKRETVVDGRVVEGGKASILANLPPDKLMELYRGKK